MNKKTKEEKEMKRPDAELAERFGVRPQMAYGEMEAANCDLLMKRILNVRGKMVMVDRDIADLYNVPTKALNQAVKRNIERFPDRFRFCLTTDEKNGVVTNCDHLAALKFSHAPVYAFTEQGVAMLATVLKSDVAVKTSIEIMDAFVAMRGFLMSSVGVLQRLGAVEIKQLETDKKIETVFNALGRGRLLPSGIIPPNTEFDSIRQVSRLVESAKSEVVVIDPYADATTLDVLSGKGAGVTVRLVCKNRGKPTVSEIAKFNRQYKGLTVSYSDDFHDRFVIIDNVELHNFGSSMNSLGRRVSTYSTRDAKEIKKLLTLLGD